MSYYRIGLVITLTLVWLLLSGHLDALLLSFGMLSVVLVYFISTRMHIIDAEWRPVNILASVLIYWVWLIREIILSNLAVIRCIIDPKLPIDPTIICVHASQDDDVGRVVFANSITLTPGTVSLDVGDHEIKVHALTSSAAEDLKSGIMNRKVCEIFGKT